MNIAGLARTIGFSRRRLSRSTNCIEDFRIAQLDRGSKPLVAGSRPGGHRANSAAASNHESTVAGVRGDERPQHVDGPAGSLNSAQTVACSTMATPPASPHCHQLTTSTGIPARGMPANVCYISVVPPLGRDNDSCLSGNRCRDRSHPVAMAWNSGLRPGSRPVVVQAAGEGGLGPVNSDWPSLPRSAPR